MKQFFVLSAFVFLISTSGRAGEFAACMERCKDKTLSYIGNVTAEQYVSLANSCAQNDCAFEAENEKEKQREREKSSEQSEKFSKKIRNEYDQKKCLGNSTPFSGMFCYLWSNPNGF